MAVNGESVLIQTVDFLLLSLVIALMTISDLKTMEIPHWMIIFGVVIGCVLHPIFIPGAVAMLLVCWWVSYAVYPFGGADVKMVAMSVLYVGWWAVPIAVLGVLVTLIAMDLMERTVLPFAPGLLVATLMGGIICLI